MDTFRQDFAEKVWWNLYKVHFEYFRGKNPLKYWYHSMHSPSVPNNWPSSIKKYQIHFKLFVRFNDLFLYIFGGSTIATYMNFAISQKNEYLQKRPIYTLFSVLWWTHFYENLCDFCIVLVFFVISYVSPKYCITDWDYTHLERPPRNSHEKYNFFLGGDTAHQF